MRKAKRTGALARAIAALGLTALLLAGCDDPAARQAEAQARASRMAAAEAARKAAEEKASAERALAERKTEAQQKDEVAKKARNALGDCCLALAKRGFEERDMKDMAAKQVCLERQTQGDTLEAARPLLAQALGERGLPATSCAP